MKKICLVFVGVFFLCTGVVQASNITIYDKNYSSATGWYGQQEDNEVEPGMETGQKWDLEGFFVNGTKLSLVGGYDFKNGQSGYTSGDIFIDIDVTGPDAAKYGDIHEGTNGNKIVQKTYGYDYVLDLDWTTAPNNPTYTVYAMNENTKVKTAYYWQNQGSSPWRYESGGTVVSTGNTLVYNPNTLNYNGFDGGQHNELIVDLSFLLTENPALDHMGFIAHYTMGCGNDNIMGQGTIPNPEPATMLLLGFGLIGLAGLTRRKLS
ncbi:MAG: PEP-CTERM sorting domain-containing protein [Desulfobacula sp.]|jgi:hypothetical protein